MRILDTYRVRETIEGVAQLSGIDSSEILKLNSNENFFMPKDRLLGFMKEVVDEYDPRVYSQGEEYQLKGKLGDYLKVPEDCIIIGNGSDELIERFVRLFLDKGDQALSITPSFALYRHCVGLQGAEYIEVPLKKDFDLDIERILAMITPKTRLFFLCCPNNPTANLFSIDEIKSLVEETPGIVVVDEAYAEFAKYSITSLIDKFENLIVVRTFSKNFGLAGLRLGYGAANLDLASTLSRKAQLPYPVSPFALRVGLKLLANIDIAKKAAEQMKNERERFINELNKIEGIKAFNSQTNFILFQTSKESDNVYQRLLSRGIIVKNLGKILHLDNCIRTTVGLPQMNSKLLKALKEIMVNKK